MGAVVLYEFAILLYLAAAKALSRLVLEFAGFQISIYPTGTPNLV